MTAAVGHDQPLFSDEIETVREVQALGADLEMIVDPDHRTRRRTIHLEVEDQANILQISGKNQPPLVRRKTDVLGAADPGKRFQHLIRSDDAKTRACQFDAIKLHAEHLQGADQKVSINLWSAGPRRWR